jgi:hypothetical protein
MVTLLCGVCDRHTTVSVKPADVPTSGLVCPFCAATVRPDCIDVGGNDTTAVDHSLTTVAQKLGTELPHLYLAVEQGEHCTLRFPDGRRLSISCTPDGYDIIDQQGRVLLSVERNLDTGRPGWDNVVVAWPEDDRFKGERPGETGRYFIRVTTGRGDDFGVVYRVHPNSDDYGLSRQLDRACRFMTKGEATNVISKLINNPALDHYDFDVTEVPGTTHAEDLKNDPTWLEGRRQAEGG